MSNSDILIKKSGESFMKKLYISDLDGTLLNNEMKLSDFTCKSINGLLDQNINFTIASARSIKSIKPLFKGINLKLPVIEFNGAFITDFNSEKHLIINDIPEAIKYNIYDYFKSKNLSPLLSTYTGKEDKLYYEKSANPGEQWYIDNLTYHKDKRLTKIDNISKKLNEYVICLTIINRAEILKILYIELNKRYEGLIQLHLMEDLYYPGWYWLTVHDKKACKANAILELLEMCSLKDHRLTVFGDNYNDMDMFKIANKAVATENAVEELKNIANQIIGYNYDDSVIKYIMEDIK